MAPWYQVDACGKVIGFHEAPTLGVCLGIKLMRVVMPHRDQASARTLVSSCCARQGDRVAQGTKVDARPSDQGGEAELMACAAWRMLDQVCKAHGADW